MPRRTYPAGPITPHGAIQLIHGRTQMYYRSPEDPGGRLDTTLPWHLMGGRAPNPNVHAGGVVLTGLKGLIAPWKHQRQQGATQDGATWNGSVHDPGEVDIECEVFGRTHRDKERTIRHWIESWDARRRGELGFTTLTGGPWWAPVRWEKQPVDQILGDQRLRQPFTWVAGVDDAFWQSYDSVCSFPPEGETITGTASGFLTLSNRGDQQGWWNVVCHGPFESVEIANGPGSTSMIKFGPLLGNQIALLRTEPRRRGVVDLTPAGGLAPTTQQLNEWQKFIRALTTFATNGNTVPFLRQFESLFGIMPQQGELYSLLDGRFTRAIPAKPIAAPPVESRMAVKVTGATSATRITAYLTPKRRWPL